uniref:DUF6383 domain-containing protein n=1 Tax=Parabacteroides distasonis TaxID=823 RepID=UPI00374E1DF6
MSTVDGLKIKLIPATVTPSAGYADYSDAELAELARLKFTVGSNVLYKDLYLKAKYTGSTPSSVEATQEALDAAEWEIIKFDCSAAESDVAKSDTIYGSTKYAYIVKDEETKTKDVKEAPRFIVKENKNGSASYYNPGSASLVTDDSYKLVDRTSIKAIFRPATLVGIDTLSTTVKGKETEVTAKNGLNNFKFQIVLKDATVEGEYIIKSLSSSDYIFNLNGKLGFTNDKSEALVVSVENGIIPTGNESIDSSASSIVVIGNAGSVTIQGAQGETAYVRNLLGMPLAETVVTSDNATIAVPAGIVLVTVGDETVKVVVK